MTKQAVVIGVATIALNAMLVAKMADRGRPYFETPRTIADHTIDPQDPPRLALTFLPQLSKVIPLGATVAVFKPVNGKVNDDGAFFVATGLLPRHQIVPPLMASDAVEARDRAEWVAAITDPLDNPNYELVATYPEGRLYKLRQ